MCICGCIFTCIYDYTFELGIRVKSGTKIWYILVPGSLDKMEEGSRETHDGLFTG